MGSVYDCFTFFNELDLLKVRLTELSDKVDYFVLCEATTTFRGRSKPLYFNENRSMFSEYLDKIIHVVVDDMPIKDEYENGPELQEHIDDIWQAEYFQRSAIRRGLIGLQPDDVVIVADCDEILRNSAIDVVQQISGYSMLDLAMFQFFLNMRERPSGWRAAFAYSYRFDSQFPDYNAVRRNPNKTFKAFDGDKQLVENAGWHFTFLGGKSKVREKLSSYSHTDGWQRSMWDDARLENQMLELRDVGGGKTLNFCRIDESFPKYVQENVSKLESSGFIKPALDRIKELELLWQRTSSVEFRSSDARQRERIELVRCKRLVQNIQKIVSQQSRNFLTPSKSFSKNWSGGVQRDPPTLLRDLSILPRETGNAVIRHVRNETSVAEDNNCGYFHVIGILSEVTYVASCWIFIPRGVGVGSIQISLGEWLGQTRVSSDVSACSLWQRIYSTATAPTRPDIQDCNVVIRANGAGEFEFLSTCWQLEEGVLPGPYFATED